MTDQVSTLNALIGYISQFPDVELVFAMEGERIRADYHVTEVKLADIRGLDCGKQTAEWKETIIQLLDGPEEPSPEASYMTVSKFVKIALAGKSKLASDDDGTLYFEFAPDNQAMRKLSVRSVVPEDNRLVVELGPVAAVCKPALRSTMPAADTPHGCCLPASDAADIKDGAACCSPR